MASSGEMVAAVADLFGMGTATVESIDRALSDAGLRKKGGRGRSAARMTGLDIVNLTFALILGAGMKDAPAAVAKVSSMPRQNQGVTWRNSAPGSASGPDVEQDTHGEDLSPFPAGPALQEADTLGAAIAAIVDAMATGEFDGVKEKTINLQMNSRGPHAILVYTMPIGTLRSRYETVGDAIERPVFERNLKLDEILLERLADVIRPARP